MSLHYRVRDFALKQGMRPSALIRRAGVSSSVGWKMLNNSASGKRGGPPVITIHTPTLIAFAKVLNVSPLDLIEFREEGATQ